MNKCDNCKHKISKKSFKNLCKDKLDLLKIQLCRTEIEELVYDLGIKRDEKIDYIAIHTFTSPSTVKRILNCLYERTKNLPNDIFTSLFGTNLAQK